MEIKISWVEVGGIEWSWLEMAGDDWSWVEVESRFSNTLYYIGISLITILERITG